jgi:hypothetical protein
MRNVLSALALVALLAGAVGIYVATTPAVAWAVAAENPEAHWPGSSDASGTKPAPEIRGAVAGLGGNADATRSCGL